MPTTKSLNLIDNHANVNRPTTLPPLGVADFTDSGQALGASSTEAEESTIQLRFSLAAYWLMLLVEVVLLAAGIFCLAKLDKMRATESEQMFRSAAQGVPPQSAVTLDEALQAFGARR
jgi:hypothetical protein